MTTSGPDDIVDTGVTIEDLKRRFPRPKRSGDDPSPLVTSQFVLEDDHLDLEACTRAIGKAPTRSSAERSIRGHHVQSGKVNIRKPYWILEIEKEPSYSTDEGMLKLLDLLWPRRKEIAALLRLKRYDAGFNTNVTIYEDRPVYCLSLIHI